VGEGGCQLNCCAALPLWRGLIHGAACVRCVQNAPTSEEAELVQIAREKARRQRQKAQQTRQLRRIQEGAAAASSSAAPAASDGAAQLQAHKPPTRAVGFDLQTERRFGRPATATAKAAAPPTAAEQAQHFCLRSSAAPAPAATKPPSLTRPQSPALHSTTTSSGTSLSGPEF
jgi:hypothetical protein